MATAIQVLGTCHHDCPDSCGWVATVEDGIATRLRGNPDHPYSQGELCPKVNRFLERVYSPERILHPLLRSGPKGSGEFRPVSWDEALAVVAAQVTDAVAAHGGQTVLPWGDAGTQGLLQCSSLDQAFFARIRASRIIGSICGATARAGSAAVLGSGRGADAVNLRHARLVLLWGTNTRLTNRHLWPFVEEARANGATIVVIDPVRTMTAESADWFVQPLPGTDVALMLAMMHVLIRDDLVDHDYVARYSVGYPELAARAAAWPPERASAVCGVEAGEIERLATAYGTATPAFIRTMIGAEHYERGPVFFQAVQCLAVLTGSWRHLGGGVARSVGSWNSVDIDEAAFDASHLAGGVPRRSFEHGRLGEALTDPTMDPAVHVLFVWNGNPVVTLPNAERTRAGLRRDDLFTVVSEQFMTDTARYADVIFPATTQLEQLDVVPAWGHLYLGWNEPAIAPLGEAVPNTELWRRLARAMGFEEPELYRTDEELLALALPTVDRHRLRTEGFLRHTGTEDLMPYAHGGFATASGKAELVATELVALGFDAVPDYVPARESLDGDPDLVARYPLALLTPKQHTRFLNASYTHLPAHGPKEGGPFVELDPVDAADRGIADGDQVRVWNDRSELVLAARVSKRLRPGVVAVPFGWWSADHGHEATANSLTSDTPTDWGGGVAYNNTLVQVSRR
jgi:anaerobic selenocysteine-containing dehydrogenase